MPRIRLSSVAMLLGAVLAASAARAGDSGATPASPATATAAASAAAAAAPRISFPLKEIDFGQAVQGDAVERRFKFRNAGGAPLSIRRVKSSCGCTAALASRADVGPGESGEISVTFATGERTGFQNVEIHVFHNDALEQDMGPQGGGNLSVLRLRGEIVQLVSMMPMSLYFESFQRGTAVERRVTVLPTDRTDLRALSVTSPYPWLRARAEPWKRGGKTGFELIVDVARDAPIGKIDDPIIVATDHPRQRTLRVPAFGQIHGRIVAFPDRIDFAAQSGDAEKSPTIFLMRVAEGEGLTIDGVDAPPEIGAETIEVIPGKRAEIALKLNPGARPGPFRGVVRVFLRDPEQPMFEIPVVGEVPRRVALDPQAVWLGGREAAVTVAVRGAKVLGVSIGGEAAKGPAVAQATLEGAEGVESRIVVRVASTAPGGPLRATLVIRTDAPGEETVEVPVRGLLAEK